jgi:gliding motility-associated-like protein
VSASTTVTEPSVLSASTSFTNPPCAGDGGTASVAAAGGTMPYAYTWNSVPAQTSPMINAASGTYTVTVVDAHGCSFTASATIAPAPPPLIASIDTATHVLCAGGNNGASTVAVTGGTTPYSYAWNTSPAQTTATASGLTAGSHSVLVTDNNGCTDTAVVVITEPSALAISQQTTSSCPGIPEASATVKASGGIPPYSLVWGTTPAQFTDTIKNVIPGTYYITVTDSNGCIKTDPVIIPAHPKPQMDAGPDQAICKGSTTVLQGSGAPYLFWSGGLLSCNSCPDPSVSPVDSTTYMLVGINEFNCRDTDFVKVTILVPFPIEVGPDRDICEGDTAMLSVTGGTEYEWIPATGLNNSRSPNPIASPGQTTEYTVLVKGNPCFTDTFKQVVTVHPVPTVDLGPDHKGLAGTEFQINAIVTNASFITWSPVKLLSCTDCFNPIATLEHDITYTATVSNEGGCKATDQINIKVVCDNTLFFMPNTFTPNGDGNNDFFYPMGKAIKKVNQFSIYSRWGELLYRVENVNANIPSIGWDGKFKGVELKPDVYVYFLDAICTNDDRIYLKSDISLIR